MKPRSRFSRAQRMPVVNAMLILVLLIVIVQLWLLTATTNAFLAGDTTVALPAALVSIACLGLNLSLLRYLRRFE